MTLLNPINVVPASQVGPVHFIAAGGSGMSGIARLYAELGIETSGSDQSDSTALQSLARAGITVTVGHDVANLADAATVVISSAVRESNVELAEARRRGLRVWHRSAALAALMMDKRGVSIAGTHGKTTTTAMLAWILECAGLQPGFLIGGVPLNFGVSARLGTGNAFVIEADEYDTAFFDKRSKFVHYRPRTAVLNNLEFDHADIFDDLAAIERQFHHLVRTVPSQGRVVVNANEASLQRVLAQGCWSERVPFGSTPDRDGFNALGEPDNFKVLRAGVTVARVQWAIGGMHNQRNALAAIAAAEHVGVAPELAAEALASFQNVKRRMEVRGVVRREGGDITVYDDFAHHPTAIHTTVDGLRRQLNSAGKGAERILAIFEPRSNTMKLGAMTAQLPWSLEQADLAFCHAGGLDWDARAALAPMGERAQVADSLAQLLAQVSAAARPGDHLLCMSNGGFGGIHAKLLAALAA